MQKTCDLCGDVRLRSMSKECPAALRCPRCESSYYFYFRQDGEVFTYPRSWGRVVSVIDEPQDEAVYDEEGNPVPHEECMPLFRSPYYFFVADDGTIRRACMREIPEPPAPPKGGKPKALFYLIWCVDVLPRSEK